MRYGPIFKIAIFGHETWQVAKVPEVAHIPSFYPRGSKLSLLLLYWQQFLRCGPKFHAIFGHETCHWTKCQKLYIYFLNYPPPPPHPRVPIFTPFCSTAGHFQDIVNFPFPIGQNLLLKIFYFFCPCCCNTCIMCMYQSWL